MLPGHRSPGWDGYTSNSLARGKAVMDFKSFHAHATCAPVLLLASDSFCFGGQRQVSGSLWMDKVGVLEDELGEGDSESFHLPPTGM